MMLPASNEPIVTLERPTIIAATTADTLSLADRRDQCRGGDVGLPLLSTYIYVTSLPAGCSKVTESDRL